MQEAALSSGGSLVVRSVPIPTRARIINEHRARDLSNGKMHLYCCNYENL